MSDEEILSHFSKLIRVEFGGRGRRIVRCPKNLWMVDCADLECAIREAFHYFRQYYSDGEYNDLLK